MVSHNIEQIPKQQCQLFLVQTTLLQAVVDYESYKFYKYSYSIFAFSDHQITPVIAKAITRREFSERNKAEICKALRNTSWDHLYSIEDAHDVFEYFHSVKKSISIPYITEYEIATILSGINNSSPGWDNIPSLILKPFIKEYIKPLTYVINKSLESGKFPNLLKIQGSYAVIESHKSDN